MHLAIKYQPLSKHSEKLTWHFGVEKKVSVEIEVAAPNEIRDYTPFGARAFNMHTS
jgi:hypothetical protein